jgi:hypothetical protein
MSQQKYLVRSDDIDRHGEGCDCGNCDPRGRSWGAGIFAIEALDDCVERLYADSEEAAIKRAEDRAKELGKLVTDPDQP